MNGIDHIIEIACHVALGIAFAVMGAYVLACFAVLIAQMAP